MADGHRQCIGGIFRFDHALKPRERSDHHLHLLFFGPAIADHADFDCQRRIFAQRDLSLGDGQQRDAAHMRQLQGRLNVLRIEDFFHRGRVGLMAFEHGSQSLGDRSQPLFQRRFDRGADHAVRENAVAAAVAFDDAPAGALGSAVDAQNTHERLARR